MFGKMNWGNEVVRKININKNHPKRFFKYMSASTAEIVLKTRTLRWSHPSKFDDTRDVARVCDENMDKGKQKKIQDMTIDLAANPPANLTATNTNEGFYTLSQLLQSSCNKTSVVSEMKEGHHINISGDIADLNEHWAIMRNDFRILCLSVENNNRRLWNDYAEAYEGVVIEFACREEPDSPWRGAVPVEYVKEEDLFLTAEDWAEALSLNINASARYVMEKCSIRKAKDNKHKWFEQNEWRIPSFCRPHETGMVSDYDVNPKDFTAIYFGHKMSDQTQKNILSLLDGELSHVSAFQCKINRSQNVIFKKL